MKLNTFKVFHIDSASVDWPLFGYYWENAIRSSEILTKASLQQDRVVERSFRILYFCSNGIHPTLTVSVHFGVQFTAGKPDILLKPNISAKASSSGISNNICPRSHENHRILVKLSKKNPIFSTKIWSKLTAGIIQRVIQNSHIACNKTIYLQFLDAEGQLIVIGRSRFYLE